MVPVFEKKDIMNILVEDCGGYGRALEVLGECMNGRTIENCNIDNLMNEIRIRLTDRYEEVIASSRNNVRVKLTVDRLEFFMRLIDSRKSQWNT